MDRGGAPALQKFVQLRRRGQAVGGQTADLPVHRPVLLLHRRQALAADQPQPVADGGEAVVRVVLPQQQPVLATAGHHPVWLVGALGHQIVDEGADVGLAPGEDQGRLPLQLQGGVDPGHKALDRRLLVAGGAAELPGPVEARDPLHLQGGPQLQGVHAVVLDGVGRAHDLRPLQPRDGVEQLHLHLLGQGGGEPLDVQLLGVQAHGLDEELVPGLVREAGDLGLNGGAVPGAHPLDDPAVHGGAVQVLPDDPVGLLVGVGEVAHCTVHRLFPGLEGEGQGVGVPLLELHFGEIHRPGVDPWGRAGLEPAEPQAQLPQAEGQGPGGEHAVGAALPDALPHDGPAAEVGAGADDGGPDRVHRPGVEDHLVDGPVPQADVHHLPLAEGQALLPLQGVLHHLLVQPPVRLGPEGPHRRPLPPVEHPVLDAGPVGGLRHLAPQGVQLPDQVALAGAADGGVAGHVAHRVQVDGEADGPHPQAGGGQGRLDASVARADDGDVKLSSGEFFHCLPLVSSE